MNCIHLFGPISADAAANFFPAFAEAASAKGRAPVLVRLCTPGGDASAGLAIYDLIMSTPRPTIIEAYGECSSVGMVVLQAGRMRRVSASLRSLIHNGSLSTGDGLMPGRHLASAAREMKKLDEFMHRLMARHSGQDLKVIQKLCDNETVLSASDIVAFGLADDLIENIVPKE